MTAELFDVAVIGGGIAGCAAAIQLARQGRRVVLCEAKSYPHHKVCGEFLSPECAVLLDGLGLSPAIQAINPAAIHTAAILAPDRTTWETSLPGTALGISRFALDDLMARHARICGVDFRENSLVNHLEGNLNATFTLDVRSSTRQDTIRARTVIGAHGKRSSVDRDLNRAFLKTSQPFIGLKAHFYGAPLPGRIHLHSFPGGYCGLSEIENGQMNVCLLVREATFQAVSAASSDPIPCFIDWMKSQNAALADWFSTAQPVYDHWLTIAQIPFVHKETIMNDVLMVGDAAGVIAPLAGDGMGMALQSSRIASSLVGHYLNAEISADKLRRQYTADWRRVFGVRLRLSRLLQELMLRPDWLTPGLRLLNTAPTIGRFLMNHTRDTRLVQS